MAQPIRIVTVGVYGSDEASFFRALQESGIDTFCDVRWRRGMRGSLYAFANSARLQGRLGELGIRYLHTREVAPPPTLREAQALEDKKAGITKRQRTTLGETFVSEYVQHCLANFSSKGFLEQLGDAKVVALFCVERQPEACHRSLLANRLRDDLGVRVEHLIPGSQAT